MSDSNPVATFSYLAMKLSQLGLAYLHVYEPLTTPVAARTTGILRKEFVGTFIVNGGYDADVGNEVIARGAAALVAFGSSFLANPDLPERLLKKAAPNAPDFATFFSGEESGYIDYPKLSEVRSAAHAALGD